MELRVLRYFLAVAREESISDAAEFLHITQPTLSRQLMDLEEELGKQLLIRGKRNRKIMLTEDGMRLRKRAEEIVALADKTEAKFLAADDAVSGDVYIGCGESDAMRIIAKTAVKLRRDYPEIHFHLYSGNAEDVSERMEKGLLDFGIFITSANIDKYDYLKLPAYDTWGLIMRKSDKLAAKDFITPQDLEGLPLIMSRQALVQEDIGRWSKKQIQNLNVVATYNLVYNAAIDAGQTCQHRQRQRFMLPPAETGTAHKFKSRLEKVPDFLQGFAKVSGIPEKRNQCIKIEDSSLHCYPLFLFKFIR